MALVAIGDRAAVGAWVVLPADDRGELRRESMDLGDLEIGPDGRLCALSDRSCSLVRLGDLPSTGGTAHADQVWAIEELDGEPEGLAFTRQGRAIVALDTRKTAHYLLLLAPPVAVPPG